MRYPNSALQEHNLLNIILKNGAIRLLTLTRIPLPIFPRGFLGLLVTLRIKTTLFPHVYYAIQMLVITFQIHHGALRIKTHAIYDEERLLLEMQNYSSFGCSITVSIW